jgi:biopolymer transport protein ExbD
MGMDVGAKKGPRSDINITPLVDVVLVLLIIFMVLTPLLEKQLQVRVPDEPEKTEVVTPPDPDLLQIVFKVDEAGVFHINSETLTDDNAVERLQLWFKAAKAKERIQGPPVIFFDADDKTKYGRAIKALDLIRDSSSDWTIGMMTEKIATPNPGTEQPPGGEAAPGATPGATPGAPVPGGAPPPTPPPAPEPPK